MKPFLNKEEIAKIFGVTISQVNNQYQSNYFQINKLKQKAAKTGKKINGQTATEWAIDEARFINILNSNI